MQGLTEALQTFCDDLKRQERAKNTISSYETDIRQFIDFLQGREMGKACAVEYKKHIAGLATSTQNRKLIALNKFFRYIGREDCTVKVIKIQRNDLDDVMSVSDYQRCLKYAQIMGKAKSWHIMKTLAGTGIRISELKYITIEAVKAGKALVDNKGKRRVIPISKELAKILKAYAKTENVATGPLFISASGKPLDRTYIHNELKSIAGRARVKKSRVHAHSFRHLFALAFLKAGNNIAELADILGHSSLETTRIYLRTSTEEKAAKMGALGL